MNPKLLNLLETIIPTSRHGHRLNAVEAQLTSEEMSSLGSQLGEVLARVHAIQFPSAGFLNWKLEIAHSMESFGEWMRIHLFEQAYNPRVLQLLSATEFEKLTSIISNPELFTDFNQACLVHGNLDFSQIMVHEGKLTGILNWDKALSASPLIDLGTLFRNREEDSFEKSFLKSYGANGGKQWSSWRRKANLADLSTLFQNLSDSSVEKVKANLRIY